MERAIRYALRANAHAKQGNPDRALSDYDRAVTSHGGVFRIQMQRGDAYFLAGDNEAALESYEAAVTLNPDSAIALIYRAMILAAAAEEDLRNPAQALSDALRANQLEPGQPAYIEVLAVAYAAKGDFDTAVEEAQRAISLLPSRDQSSRDDYQSRLALMLFCVACHDGPGPVLPPQSRTAGQDCQREYGF
jgi:tetratricopeptide (TPR) repeat protein